MELPAIFSSNCVSFSEGDVRIHADGKLADIARALVVIQLVY
jgi:hypothetical protein